MPRALTDALGSVIMLTNTTQTKTAAYAHDAWTNTIASSGTQATLNPWQYASGYKDTTTSLTKFGARYYDPTTGRFNQPNPSGQEQNNYLYAAANPINYADPSGLVCYSFNKDTPECGYYGPPVPDVLTSCKLGGLLIGLTFLTPLSGVWEVFLEGSAIVTIYGCVGG